jgi:hypothetical protein
VFGLTGLVLAKLTAAALVVALSPIPVVVALVLLVHNDRPHWSSLAYLFGRVISLAALTAVFIRVPRLFDGLKGPAPAWTSWLVVAAGAAFVVLGARLWRRRRAAAAKRSQWEHRVGRISPLAAASIGIFPMWTNPKILAASAAAGTEIATVRLTAVGAAVAVVFYAALASAFVAAPVLAYLAVGPRIDPHLERIRRWLAHRRHAMTASTLVVVGLATVLYGMA